MGMDWKSFMLGAMAGAFLVMCVYGLFISFLAEKNFSDFED